MKRKILVTGGCGFIGSNVIKQLARGDDELFVIDDLSVGSELAIPKKRVTLLVSDIRSEEATFFIKEIQPTHVIHLAAQTDVQTSIKIPKNDASINLVGTLNIIEACREVSNFQNFVFASSAAVYGDNIELPLFESSATIPTSPYGQSKLEAEKYLELFNKLYGFPYTALRFANVYGNKFCGGHDVISNFWKQIEQEQPLILYGDGNQTRDFVYVTDIAKALIEAMDISDNDIYNISTNEQTSINNILTILSDLLNIKLKIEYKSQRVGDIKNSRLSNHKFIEATTWKPQKNIKEGLFEMKENKKNKK